LGVVVFKNGVVAVLKILLFLYYSVQNYGYCFYLILCRIFGELYVKILQGKETMFGLRYDDDVWLIL